MRTNVVIDDELMESALKVSGLKTKKDVYRRGVEIAGTGERPEKNQGLSGETQMGPATSMR